MRSHRLEDAIKAITRIKGRTPGELLREIAVIALMGEDVSR
ncbi:hypothetical protein WME99_34570 [Sorangium sp. So ce136]